MKAQNIVTSLLILIFYFYYNYFRSVQEIHATWLETREKMGLAYKKKRREVAVHLRAVLYNLAGYVVYSEIYNNAGA